MDLADPTPRVLRFGVFELDRRSGELRKQGVRVRVQEQPLRVLEALLAEPGEPVTREALRQRLWPDDTFVDFDNGLNRAINRLRAALGDEADNPRFIETLERRGYRFIAPVGLVDMPSSPAPAPAPETTPSAPETTTPPTGRGRGRNVWLAGALAAAALLAVLIAFTPVLRRSADTPDHPRIRSLAVLPLANLTGDPAQEYFSDGMTDALITNLASLPALRVISRQSVMRYKGSATPLPEIARELGVEGVVQGSVVRSGGRVRITAQLVHAPTDRHLWAHSYERRLEDVLALQGELARAIAEAVQISVGTKEGRRLDVQRAVKPDAYDAYLLGWHQGNQRTEQGLDRALGHFRAAVASDPDFALGPAVTLSVIAAAVKVRSFMNSLRVVIQDYRINRIDKIVSSTLDSLFVIASRACRRTSYNLLVVRARSPRHCISPRYHVRQISAGWFRFHRIAPRSVQAAPASSSARSTTPQISRMCWRDASSGTTPPHSR